MWHIVWTAPLMVRLAEGAADVAKSVNLAPHGFEKSARRWHEASAVRQGRVRAGPLPRGPVRIARMVARSPTLLVG
jgi:hypothetical protein